MTMLASQITSLTVVYSIVYSGVNQRKHQSSASLAFVWEIHRGPVNFPHKWPVTRKMFPFDDVIMTCSWTDVVAALLLMILLTLLSCVNSHPRVTLTSICLNYRWSSMMTSSNANIFSVTGPLCGEFTGPGEFRAQRPVTQSFDVFFDLRLNKRLSKQPRGCWFETPSWSLWRQCNATMDE